MSALGRAISWAQANKKYTLGAAVLILVFVALTHPGAKTDGSYSAEVLLSLPYLVGIRFSRCQIYILLMFHAECRSVMQLLMQ